MLRGLLIAIGIGVTAYGALTANWAAVALGVVTVVGTLIIGNN